MPPNELAARQPPSYDPFAPCQQCGKKIEYIHVITHECLEGDALRCVIKAVPDDAPLELEDYVRVGDLVRFLTPDLNPKPRPSRSKTQALPPPTGTPVQSLPSVPAPVQSSTTIGLLASSSSVAAGVSTPGFVVTPGLSSSTAAGASSASPTVLTITFTDVSTTITTTTTLGAGSSPTATGSPSGYVSTAASSPSPSVFTLPSSSSLTGSPPSNPSPVISLPSPNISLSPSSSLTLSSLAPSPPQPTLITLIHQTISCTTLTHTSISTLTGPPASFSIPAFSFPFSFPSAGNSVTIYAPSGGWPFQRSSKLTASPSPTALPAQNRVFAPGRVQDKPADRPVGNVKAGFLKRGDGEGKEIARSVSDMFIGEEAAEKFGEKVGKIAPRDEDSNDEDAVFEAQEIPPYSDDSEDIDVDVDVVDADADADNDDNDIDENSITTGDDAESFQLVDVEVTKILVGDGYTLNPNNKIIKQLKPLSHTVARRQDAPVSPIPSDAAAEFSAAIDAAQGGGPLSDYEQLQQPPRVAGYEAPAYAPWNPHVQLQDPLSIAAVVVLGVAVLGLVGAAVAWGVKREKRRRGEKLGC